MAVEEVVDGLQSTTLGVEAKNFSRRVLVGMGVEGFPALELVIAVEDVDHI